ncbi:fimbria/pilus outer membrane usher protein [Shimwellia blattae]|uniref:Putative fimbrial biogenesis outer membrane usher protein n=1 Tax=Shimwellia blattae (strain ATCC 29907 / DSM 4481 / JCM 1650 / NBRC 105725 / CDC 9005-74) TaxID=630626 RepID=I2B3S1_SHIBC|nr:fimbria/pilus outer membrane usher protein [Shimwellia blattae]AFJ45175.1 putative fimbrial biogenesis outer membrane usher protein [Shimwellia blattae DSM 4481 = NBRC 105725]VDY62657.1 Heat shock protein E [Shimwellia blattae]VEC19380.1 Heat shock protein E [Shimwellia blattae]
MKQRTRSPAMPCTAMILVLYCSAVVAGEKRPDQGTVYQFNDGFIVGSREKVDLSRFSSSAISEGDYSVDVYTNGEWKGRRDLHITRDEHGELGVCYTREMLAQFGIASEKLNRELSQQSGFCGRLSAWRKDPMVKDTLIQSALRLEISVPQIYEDQLYKHYISPAYWDRGIAALNLGWNANVWNNHTSSAGGSDNNSAYLGINGGLSWDGWLLKHIGNMNWQEKQGGAHWKSNQTYLQRPIPQINAIASGGQIFTSGEFFDTIGLRGASLATDDNMFPDGIRSYAPEIRGVANSNALVTVRQGSNIIYQTTVPPGPFTLTDVYPSGYGSDLEVSVKEADGSTQVFSVPYASVAQLLRPGMTRYALSAGKVDSNNLRNKPVLWQGTWQHGLNNMFTLYTGTTGFNDYQAFLLGTGMNTGIGALSFDITQSQLKLDSGTKRGQSYRATFNRMFAETETSIVLAAYRYSTENYYNLSDALYAVDQEKHRDRNYSLWRERNGFSFTVNQNLPEGWGGVYLSGRISDYWERSGTEKQYQLSYNNMYGRLSWTLGVQRVYTPDSSGNRRDDRVSLNLSYPLWIGEGRTANLTSNTVWNDSHFASAQVGVNGSLDSDSNLNYGVSTTTTRGGNHDVALNGSYRSPWTTMTGSYSQGEGYRQSGIGASGTVIAHRHGVAFSPETGTTMALVEAKDAAGATLPGSPGTRVDRDGYAILPYLRPYRINAVEIDPKGSESDVAFENTVAQVVPWEGSVVKVTFGTRVQNSVLVHALQAGGQPLPFGATITDASGNEIGVVGQGSMMFINEATAPRAIVKWSSGQCTVQLDPAKSKEKVCR